jgi:hypothetical protein
MIEPRFIFRLWYLNWASPLGCLTRLRRPAKAFILTDFTKTLRRGDIRVPAIAHSPGQAETETHSALLFTSPSDRPSLSLPDRNTPTRAAEPRRPFRSGPCRGCQFGCTEHAGFSATYSQRIRSGGGLSGVITTARGCFRAGSWRGPSPRRGKELPTSTFRFAVLGRVDTGGHMVRDRDFATSTGRTPRPANRYRGCTRATAIFP